MRGGLAALGFFVVLRVVSARWPGVAEAWAHHVAPALARVVGVVPGLVPFSVAEPIVYSALAGSPLALAWTYRRRRRDGTGRTRALGETLARAAAVAGVVLLSFDLVWGLHYARPDLAHRLRLAPVVDDGHLAKRELEALAAELVTATNAAYRALHGQDDLGRPTAAPPLTTTAHSLDGGFVAAAAAAVLPGDVRRHGGVKPFASSVVLSHLGLSGFFFPWTAEANVNVMLPGASLPHVAAHEMAHHRGFAREDEAQFAGFLACVLSTSAEARYSGLLYAQRELLVQLQRDVPLTQELLRRRVPGVQRDVDDMFAFWARFHGPPARAASAVNHAYLTAQGVPGGISSYRRGVRLLLLCAREGRAGCAPPFGKP